MLSAPSSSCLKGATGMVSRRGAAKLIARAAGTSSGTTKIPTTTPHQRRTVVTYAAVTHAQEYKDQMDGRHGTQLQLAVREGNEKSDGTHFNPFEAYAVPAAPEDAIDRDAGDGEQRADPIDGDAPGDDPSDDPSSGEDGSDGGDIEESFLSRVRALYHPDGTPRSLTPARKNSLRAGLPAGGSFAVIQLAGSQQKVTVDDVVILNKLRPVEKYSVGSTHVLTDDNVLLMGDPGITLVGLPYVKGGEVEVMVEEITRDKTIDVFKKRRRKNSKRKNGFRRQVTFLRIVDIRFPEKHRDVATLAASDE